MALVEGHRYVFHLICARITDIMSRIQLMPMKIIVGYEFQTEQTTSMKFPIATFQA